jgi:uncharacterized coiled-coil protein SlyX
MRKLKLHYTALVLSFLLCGQSARALQGESAGRYTIQQRVNFLQSATQNLQVYYNQVWQKSKRNTSPPSNNTGGEISNLLTEGSDLFRLLDQQLAALQAQLADSETIITDLQKSLQESQGTIMLLWENLNQVSERIQASNEWLVQAYDDLDLLEAQNTARKIGNKKLRTKARRSGIIGVIFGSLGFGAGVPLIAEGIQTDNQTMLWTGAGAVIGTGAIWALGRFVIGWW